MKTLRHLQQGWAMGIFGGALSWYGAHELGFFFADLDCQKRWILKSVHALALIICLTCVWLSYRAYERNQSPTQKFIAGVGVGAAALFAIVIFWQGLAAVIYSGCER